MSKHTFFTRLIICFSILVAYPNSIAQSKLSAPANLNQENRILRLINNLKNSDVAIREQAAEELGKVAAKDSTAIQSLIVALGDNDPYVAGKAATALSRSGKEATGALIEALQDTCSNIRWGATIAIGKMGIAAQQAIPALIHALKDSNEHVRWCAVIGLGEIGICAKEAVSSLLQLLCDPDEDVRWGANLALRKIDPASVDSIMDWRTITAISDSLMPELMQELHVPGASMALIDNRKLIWSNNFGITCINQPEPITDETLFEACSMTKPVFAYIVLKLAEQGRLDLDQPLVQYFSENLLPDQEQRRRITARMVLSHTTGFPNWRKGEEEMDGPLPVLFEPGSKFGYSGEAFYLLQRVVGHLTGEPLEIYARRMLFQPLGLQQTSFAWNDEIDANLASGHDAEGAFLKKTKYVHANAAYTLYTTARDYALFLIEIMKTDRTANHSLSQKSIDAMLSPQVKLDIREPIGRPGKAQGKTVYWGLGWSINATEDGDFFHHSGANRSGFRCFAQFHPQRGSGIVIMTNGVNGSELWTRLIQRIGNF